jgi:pSer/pThr/pTyr-binding forkhead associated (FHA) protein
MGERAPAILFAPPLPPVRLEEGREAVLGRGEGCEVRVDSTQASRRHAAVRSEGEAVKVRDLGSTNGTFVNGERVEGERALRPGDRIEVGGVAVTFCRIDPTWTAAGPRASAGDRTVLFDAGTPAPAPATVLHGRLEEIPTYAVLQMLEMGGKTGRLTLEGDDGPVHLWIASGRPVHAEAQKTRGQEAAFAGLRLDRGAFRFEAGSAPPETTLAASLTELLLEAARLGDEDARQC